MKTRLEIYRSMKPVTMMRFPRKGIRRRMRRLCQFHGATDVFLRRGRAVLISAAVDAYGIVHVIGLGA